MSRPATRPIPADAAPAVRFAWLDADLPAGAWPEPLREALCVAIREIGWPLVERGDFAPLEQVYCDVVSIYPRLLVGREDMDRAAHLYTLLHIMLWRRTQRLAEVKAFNADVVAPFVDFLSRHAPGPTDLPRHRSRSHPRIAYLSETSDLFGSNAVARITVSLMLVQKEVAGGGPAPILYCLNRPSEALLAFMAEHRLEVRDLYHPNPSVCVEAVLAQIAADGIDILVADHNGAVATMVMQRRPAAVQAFHENGYAAWAIPELDLALLGITPPSDGLFAPGVVMAQTPRNTAFVFQRMPRPAEVVAEMRDLIRTASGIDRPSVVYGVYGRMAKITAAYMARVEAILLADPQAVFFAGGTGCIAPLLACEQASAAGQRMVILNDFVDGHVIGECLDVFLDTDPFPGGMSCVEVQARGVPVVWMAPADGDEQQIIGDQRDAALEARDADDYVRLARSLADPAIRAERGETARVIAARFGDMREQARLVDRHLRAAWDRALGAGEPYGEAA